MSKKIKGVILTAAIPCFGIFILYFFHTLNNALNTSWTQGLNWILLILALILSFEAILMAINGYSIFTLTLPAGSAIVKDNIIRKALFKDAATFWRWEVKNALIFQPPPQRFIISVPIFSELVGVTYLNVSATVEVRKTVEAYQLFYDSLNYPRNLLFAQRIGREMNGLLENNLDLFCALRNQKNEEEQRTLNLAMTRTLNPLMSEAGLEVSATKFTIDSKPGIETTMAQ